MGITPHWEALDVRVWDKDYRKSRPLYPRRSLQLEHREDISVDRMVVVISDTHPEVPALRQHRTIPVPVTLEVNGVLWSGLVTELVQSSEGDVRVTVAQDTKHAHRLLARARTSAAVDADATQIRGGVGALTLGLLSEAAQRTGLPLYVAAEHTGDPVDLEVRAEATVADVVAEALESSDTFLDMRVLLPGHELPGEGDIVRVRGAFEGPWERDRLEVGAWPHATADARLKLAAVAPATTPTPPMSWVGEGAVNTRGVKLQKPERGICWMPFSTSTDSSYFRDRDVAGVRVATAGELQGEKRTGWHEHVTFWYAGTFGKNGDTALLEEAATAGLLTRTDGTQFDSAESATAYVGAGAAYAWHDGARWILATTADFHAENSRRNPPGPQRQTPGILARAHQGRDRRGIVFSSTPGGGLERWETTTRSPEAAMIHASAQLDAATLEALKAGTLTATSQVGELTPATATTLLGSKGEVPETVEAVDVSAQPLVTVAGTEVAYSRLGGRVNVNAAGPFFYREMNLSLASSSNPAADLGREWAKAQGGATVALTPGHGVNTVFGDDVQVDGRTVQGWRPGDRISFVDGESRISEVVAGYILEERWDSPLSVVPVLGRTDGGVMDTLMRRVRGAEDAAQRALTQAPRKAETSDVDTVVETNTTVATVAETTRSIMDTLGGSDAQGEDILAQLVAVNDELQRLGQNPQPSLMLAFVSLSTALWEAQQEIDAVQTAAIAENEARIGEIAALTDELVKTQQELVARRIPVLSDGNDGQHFSRSGTTVTARGEWIGDVQVLEDGVGPRAVRIPNPEGGRTISLYNAGSWVTLLALVSQGVMRRFVRGLSTSFPSASVSWGYVAGSPSFTASTTGAHTIRAKVEWERAIHLATYGLRIVVGGVVVKTIEQSNIGPLFGSGVRSQMVTASDVMVNAGKKIELQVRADTGEGPAKWVRSLTLDVVWVEGA